MQPMRLCFIIVAMVLALSGTALARDLKFITIDVAPWAFVDKDGQPGGLFTALVRQLERRSGHSIQISLQPFIRIGHELEAGNRDCGILVWNDQWSSFAQREETLFNHHLGVIPRKGVVIRNYDDLRPLKLSVLRGLSLGEPFDSDSALNKSFDMDYAAALQRLVRNRVDAVIGAIPTLRFLAHQIGDDHALGDPLILASVPLALQCSRRSANLDVLPELNDAIRRMKADGTLDRLIAEFGFE